MAAQDTELVCLFRCKLCGTRMFWRDCRGHMDRHGIATNGDLRSYFTRGPKNVPARPGAHYQPINYGRTSKTSPSA